MELSEIEFTGDDQEADMMQCDANPCEDGQDVQNSDLNFEKVF